MPPLPQKGTAVTLSDTGVSRVNGYLFVLERSLATFLPRDSMRDVVREIDSHLRDRISSAEPVPDERAMLEKMPEQYRHLGQQRVPLKRPGLRVADGRWAIRIPA
jgi:hypothetical protein